MTSSPYRSPYYRVLGVLLDYPCADFARVLAEAEDFLSRPPACEREGVAGVRATVRWMQHLAPLELERIYVQTFDLTPAHSLHLTAHLLEEQDRRRGPALIRLRQHYEISGLNLLGGELPDYLPAVLEFAATLGEQASATFLDDADPALEILERNLHRSKSAYAQLVTGIRMAVHSSMATAGITAEGS